MKIPHIMVSLSTVALVIGGCSSRPRQFTATINPPASDEAAYHRDFASCDILALKGYKSDFKALALSTAGGTAVGFGVGVAATSIAATSAITAGGIGGIGTGLAAGVTAGTGALLIVGLPVGFGISRAIRGGREKRLKRSLSACLGEYGYTVADWSRVKKPKKIASTAS